MDKFRFSKNVWKVSRRRIRQIMASERKKNQEKTKCVETSRKSNVSLQKNAKRNFVDNSMSPTNDNDLFTRIEENPCINPCIPVKIDSTCVFYDEIEHEKLTDLHQLNNSSNNTSKENESYSNNLNELSLNKALRKVFIKHQLSVRAINDTLGALGDHNINVPKTKIELFKSSFQDNCIEEIIGKGKFVYIGIENNLLKCRNNKLYNCESIELDIHVDGLPLYKSSRESVWPILGAVRSIPEIQPFVIAAYIGPGHPPSHRQYFEKFAQECIELEQNGIRISPKNVLKDFKIRLFCCDAPARSFVTCTKSHNSKHGCHKCAQVGRSMKNRMVFNIVSGTMRSGHSFKNREDPEHHATEFQNNTNVLEDAGFDLVNLFPLDPMHLIDLGHAKKLFSLITTKYKNMFSFFEIEMEKFAQCFPNEFARKPRSLKELPRFKATEYRMFLCYYGPILLKPVLSVQEYEHFLMIFCAVRLLSHPETAKNNAEYAKYLLEQYVCRFAELYDPTLVNYNVHNLLHIADCVKIFGSLTQFDAYPFENFLGKLKKVIRSPSNIIKQIVNRQNEMWEIAGTHMGKNKLRLEEKFDLKNSFYLLSNGVYISATVIRQINGELWFTGKRFLNCKSFFDTPLDSFKYLSICISSGLVNESEQFPYDDSCVKLVGLPFQNDWVLFPLLHN